MAIKGRSAKVISLPAPVGGWNVVDSYSDMKPHYAVIADNVFCLPSEIMVRKGYSSWATFTGTCQTLISYDKMNGTSELYAAVKSGANHYIYDVTAGGAVGAAKVSGLTSSQWKQCHFSTSGGLFLYIVNGVDTPYVYDGSTWQSVTGVSAPFAITGVTTTLLKDVVSFKHRLWFVEKNSLSCWYLPTDSLGGAASEYDFTPVFPRGGYITKIDTWTLDAGYGVDDYFVIMTSEGEVAVYRGTNPASSTTWELTGVFYIENPVGTGHTIKYGGDLLALTSGGLAQMSVSLISDRITNRGTISDKIQTKLAQYSREAGDTFGWDIALFPPMNMLLINIPRTDGTFYQCVMNTVSKAWSRWTGINSSCWKFFDEQLFFGGSGFIGKAWNTQADSGANITADVLPAYNSFGTSSRLKRYTLARVILGYDGSLSYGTRMEMDFNLNPKSVTMPLTLSSAAGVYGTAVYDSDTYGGSITVDRKWENASGLGYWGSLHIKIKTSVSDVRIYSIDLMMEDGGNI